MLRVINEPDDALERAVLRATEHAALEDALQIQRARKRGIAASFRDGLGLASEHRLVACALAEFDEDVHGHLLVRRHAHGLAGLEFADGHLALRAVLQQARGLRRVFEQGADLAVRATVGEALHRPRRGEKKHEHRTLRRLADDGCAERDEEHQEVRAELPLPHIRPHFERQIPAAGNIRADVSERRLRERAEQRAEEANRGAHSDRLPSRFAHVIAAISSAASRAISAMGPSTVAVRGGWPSA